MLSGYCIGLLYGTFFTLTHSVGEGRGRDWNLNWRGQSIKLRGQRSENPGYGLSCIYHKKFNMGLLF